MANSFVSFLRTLESEPFIFIPFENGRRCIRISILEMAAANPGVSSWFFIISTKTDNTYKKQWVTILLFYKNKVHLFFMKLNDELTVSD